MQSNIYKFIYLSQRRLKNIEMAFYPKSDQKMDFSKIYTNQKLNGRMLITIHHVFI